MVIRNFLEPKSKLFLGKGHIGEICFAM